VCNEVVNKRVGWEETGGPGGSGGLRRGRDGAGMGLGAAVGQGWGRIRPGGSRGEGMGLGSAIGNG